MGESPLAPGSPVMGEIGRREVPSFGTRPMAIPPIESAVAPSELTIAPVCMPHCQTGLRTSAPSSTTWRGRRLPAECPEELVVS